MSKEDLFDKSLKKKKLREQATQIRKKENQLHNITNRMNKLIIFFHK
jgi:hypothetical protein